VSRNKHKKAFHFPSVSVQILDPQLFLSKCTDAAQYLTPLIINERLGAGPSLVLVVAYGLFLLTGKKSGKEDDLIKASQLLLALWEEKQFIPPHDYPYTWLETKTYYKEVQG
jgi:hypothetical protein